MNRRRAVKTDGGLVAVEDFCAAMLRPERSLRGFSGLTGGGEQDRTLRRAGVRRVKTSVL